MYVEKVNDNSQLQFVWCLKDIPALVLIIAFAQIFISNYFTFFKRNIVIQYKIALLNNRFVQMGNFTYC